jgi:site-specific DNA-methyltransferase (adenine-specific)
MHVAPTDALTFLRGLSEKSVDLLLTDPPFFGIVKDEWDNQWKTADEFVTWLFSVFQVARRCLKDTGSLVFFGGHRETWRTSAVESDAAA